MNEPLASGIISREWTLLEGTGFGADQPKGGEVVFNTGMAGYQEIFTDPSYCNQIVVMTYPHLGNYGINDEDVESRGLFLSGVVAREYCHNPSNWRSTKTLHDYLAENNIPAISGVDTRHLTCLIRDEGAQRGIIYNAQELETREQKIAKGTELLSGVASMEGLELVSQVSSKEIAEFEPSDTGENFVVYDFGVKTNILRHIKKLGFRVWVVPYDTPEQEVMSLKPAAVMLSNGPGDPSTVPHAVEAIQKLIGKVPIMAVCMGHQLLARALGANCYKLKFGHHGVNHPVIDLKTKRSWITSQNHGFAVNLDELKQINDVELTHVSLNDETVEGFASDRAKLLSVQFHPEAAPGPHDADYLFKQFVRGHLQ